MFKELFTESERAKVGETLSVENEIHTIYNVGSDLRGRGPKEYHVSYKNKKGIGVLSSLKIKRISNTEWVYVK